MQTRERKRGKRARIQATLTAMLETHGSIEYRPLKHALGYDSINILYTGGLRWVFQYSEFRKIYLLFATIHFFFRVWSKFQTVYFSVWEDGWVDFFFCERTGIRSKILWNSCPDRATLFECIEYGSLLNLIINVRYLYMIMIRLVMS